MDTPTEAQVNAAVSKAGNQVDAVAKQKITVDLYVVALVGVIGNILGVLFHI